MSPQVHFRQSVHDPLSDLNFLDVHTPTFFEASAEAGTLLFGAALPA